MTDVAGTLGPFPVDDNTLELVEHALNGAYTVDPDGTHHLVGADFSLHKLLDFLSGYDPDLLEPFVGEDGHVDDDVLIYTGGPVYDERSVIRALIAEVRRLRETQT